MAIISSTTAGDASIDSASYVWSTDVSARGSLQAGTHNEGISNVKAILKPATLKSVDAYETASEIESGSAHKASAMPSRNGPSRSESNPSDPMPVTPTVTE